MATPMTRSSERADLVIADNLQPGIAEVIRTAYSVFRPPVGRACLAALAADRRALHLRVQPLPQADRQFIARPA